MHPTRHPLEETRFRRALERLVPDLERALRDRALARSRCERVLGVVLWVGLGLVLVWGT